MKDIFDSANETPLQFNNITQAVSPHMCSIYVRNSGKKEVNMSLVWFKTRLHFTVQPTISIHIDVDEHLSTRSVVAESETNSNNFKQNNIILCSEKSILTTLDHSLWVPCFVMPRWNMHNATERTGQSISVHRYNVGAKG